MQARKFADALGFADFQGSSGWLDRFKQRHGITGKCITGESAAVSEDMTSDWVTSSLPRILKQYAPKDIYNMDETGIFFRLTPDKTLTFKGDSCHGGKKSKERITAAVCANMDGSDKMELLVIGKFQNPRCFKNVKKLPVQYLANKKAWMTSEIFLNWLHKLDRKFEREGRRILMLVDNCPAHPKIENLKAVTLKFLPPNTTSCLQPMDQGIIQNLKMMYRRLVVERVLRAVENGQEIDNGTVTLLDAVRMLQSAWFQVKPETIANCFRHAGFVTSPVTDDAAVSVAATPSPAVADAPRKTIAPDVGNIWDRLRAAFKIPTEVAFEDFCAVDNDLSVNQALTDEAIVQSVMEDSRPAQNPSVTEGVADTDDNDIDDSSEPRPVSAADAMNSLAVVRDYLECCNGGEFNGFNLVAQLEAFIVSSRSMQQTCITDFFRKAT
jgi:hypothetical protein